MTDQPPETTPPESPALLPSGKQLTELMGNFSQMDAQFQDRFAQLFKQLTPERSPDEQRALLQQIREAANDMDKQLSGGKAAWNQLNVSYAKQLRSLANRLKKNLPSPSQGI